MQTVQNSRRSALETQARSNMCSISLPNHILLPKAQQLSPVIQTVQIVTNQRSKSQAQSNACSGSLPNLILPSQKPSSWLSKAEVQRIQLATDPCSKSQAQSSTCFGRPESSSACYPHGPRSQGFHSSCLSQHRRGPLQN